MDDPTPLFVPPHRLVGVGSEDSPGPRFESAPDYSQPMYTTTINLSDAITESQDRIETARQAYHELTQFAEAEYGTVEAAPSVVYQRLQAYEQAKANMEGRINLIQQTLQEWGGPTQDDTDSWTGDEFDLQMLSGPKAAEIEDRVGAAGAAMQQDVGAAPRDMSGERVTEVLSECITREPEGIPNQAGEPPSLGAYPKPVMLWLYEKANNLNTAGNPNFDSTGFTPPADAPPGDGTATDSSPSRTSRGSGTNTRGSGGT